MEHGERNVLGGELDECGSDPMTGFYRDGCCTSGPEDRGSHTICAVMTTEFLEHQQGVGNDLSTPRPEWRFPGLRPGDRWCVVAARWLQAQRDGMAAPVVLSATHERALVLRGAAVRPLGRLPVSKSAGTPCRNLTPDFSCGIHAGLREQGWKGCTVFDCFGAGQQVSQVSFGGVSWRDAPETAAQMFAVLPVMHQVHEMLAHLSEAIALSSASAPPAALARKLEKAQRELADVIGPPAKRFRRHADLVGADLRGLDLRTADLNGALLIGVDLRDADLRHADLLGADLRDADLRGSRLDAALFLTRPQLAAARPGPARGHGDIGEE